MCARRFDHHQTSQWKKQVKS